MKTISLYFSAAAILPNPNMVQMANISVHPRLNDLEPRKFTKYIPPKKRKSRNSDDFRLQNYPPSERFLTFRDFINYPLISKLFHEFSIFLDIVYGVVKPFQET